MRGQMLSTTRPSRLRSSGFIALVAGALSAGIGALLPWATVGLRADTSHALDSVTIGIDVWEGIVVLGVAVAALVALVAMRLVRGEPVRIWIAIAVGIGGAVVTALTAYDRLRLEDRFSAGGGLDRLARLVAARFPGQAAETVRRVLERKLHELVRVDVAPGLPLALAGGVMLILAGALSFAWARAAQRAEGTPDEPASAAPD